MPRAVPLVSAFNAGELSPLLYGRVDIQKYPNGCRTLLNFLPKSQGPAVRRPGTRYVANTRSNSKARLIPFEFSATQSYIIEATDNVFRFFKNGAPIETSPGVPYEIATLYNDTDLDNLRWAQSADTLYLAHPSYSVYALIRQSDTSWPLGPVIFRDGPYLEIRADHAITPSATTGVVTLTSSGAVFDASDVGRYIRLLHGSTWGHASIQSFTSSTVVTAAVVTAFGATTGSANFRLGAWGGGRGAPSVVLFHEERLFFAASIGQPNTIWGSKVGDFLNHTPGAAADDPIDVTLADNAVNEIQWMVSAKGLLAGTTGGEFAIQASSANEALTPANIKANKQTLIGSARTAPVQVGAATLFVQRAKRGLYELAYTFEADGYAAPELSVLAGHLLRGNIKEMAWQPEPWRVLWCVLEDGGLVGMTYMREQQVVAWHRHQLGGDGVRVLSAATISVANSTELWLVVERQLNNVTKRFVERLGEEFYADRVAAQDDAYFVDCGVSSGVTRPASTLRPSNVTGTITLRALSGTWVVGDVGKVVRLNGGKVLITTYTSANFVTGTVQRTLTTNDPAFAGEWSLSTLGTTFSGLAHLDGETVQVLADGGTHPDEVPASGSITLDRSASIVHAGYGYTSLLETLDIQAGAQDGTSSTRKKRIHSCGLRLFQTLGGFIGYRDEETEQYVLEEIQYRRTSSLMDIAPLLFTGDRTIDFPGRWERAAHVVCKQTQPLPMTVTAVAPRITTNE